MKSTTRQVVVGTCRRWKCPPSILCSGYITGMSESVHCFRKLTRRSNVDRLWALWQDLNPTAFITPKPAPWSTWTTRAGTIETADSRLPPFWDKTGANFWTPAQVKTTTTFGYAYPETQRWQFPTTQAYQTALRQNIVNLYGGNAFTAFAESLTGTPQLVNLAASNTAASATDLKKDAKASIVHVAAAPAQDPPTHEIHTSDAAHPDAQKPLAPSQGKEPADSPSSPGTAPIPDSLKHLAPNGEYTEWIVNVRAVKHVLGQTYRVLVFLGSINPDPRAWDLEYNCVGRVTVLGRSTTTGCAKCRDDAAQRLCVTGSVPLTSALLQDIVAGRLQDLSRDSVVPYLKQELKWRVTLFDGEEKPVAEVPGLRVSVVATNVRIGVDGLPNYSGEYEEFFEITAGQPGGAAQGDD
jgi:tyrosinase